MRRIQQTVASIVGLLCGALVVSPVAADTITFEHGEFGSRSFTQQGMTFTVVTPIPASIHVIGEGNCVLCAANDTLYLAAWGYPPASVLMTAASGNPFSLFQFEAAESFALLPEHWARRIDVVGSLFGGGTVSTSFVLDQILDSTGGQKDFQPFVLPETFTMLTSVVFVGAGNTTPSSVADGLVFQDFTLDNIVTDVPRPPAPIPEPSTVALLTAGLIMGARRCGGRGTA